MLKVWENGNDYKSTLTSICFSGNKKLIWNKAFKCFISNQER